MDQLTDPYLRLNKPIFRCLQHKQTKHKSDNPRRQLSIQDIQSDGDDEEKENTFHLPECLNIVP